MRTLRRSRGRGRGSYKTNSRSRRINEDSSDSEEVVNVINNQSAENIVTKKEMNLSALHLMGNYDGDAETCKFYFEQFDNIAEMANLDEKQKVTILKSKLTGAARKFLIADPELVLTSSYSKIKAKFLEFFTEDSSLVDLNMKFGQLRMRENERVKDFSERLRIAGVQFIGGNALISAETNEMFDKILLSKFLEGLVPELQRDVILKSPESFREAVTIANKIQLASDMFAKMRINAVTLHDSKKEFIQAARVERGEDKQNNREEAIGKEQAQQKFCIFCGRNSHYASECYENIKMQNTIRQMNRPNIRGNYRQGQQFSRGRGFRKNLN